MSYVRALYEGINCTVYTVTIDPQFNNAEPSAAITIHTGDGKEKERFVKFSDLVFEEKFDFIPYPR